MHKASWGRLVVQWAAVWTCSSRHRVIGDATAVHEERRGGCPPMGWPQPRCVLPTSTRSRVRQAGPVGWHYTQGRRRPGYRHLWCWDAKTTCDGERRVPPGRVIAGAATASSSGFHGRSLLIRCITWFSWCWCFADNYRAISSRAYGDRASQFATTICLRYRCESRWSGGPRQTGDRDCTLMSHRHDPQENPRPGFGSWISSAYACTRYRV